MENSPKGIDRRKVLKMGAQAVVAGAALVGGVKILEVGKEYDTIEKEHTFIGEGEIVNKWQGASPADLNPDVTKLAGQDPRAGYLMIRIGKGETSVQVSGDIYSSHDIGSSLRIKYTTMPGGQEQLGADKLPFYKTLAIEK